MLHDGEFARGHCRKCSKFSSALDSALINIEQRIRVEFADHTFYVLPRIHTARPGVRYFASRDVLRIHQRGRYDIRIHYP
jgi:hypothetical protein